MRRLSLSIVIMVLFFGCKDRETVSRPASQQKSSPEESIIIGGSESVLPILRLLAENFEAENPNRKIHFDHPSHTGPAIMKVGDNILTMGAVSRELKAEEKQYGLKEIWFSHEALVFCTHPSIKLKDLSSDQVRAIYYGEILNWKDLGGPDHEIVVLDRPEESSPKIILYKESFFSRDKKITDRARIMEKPQDMDIALTTTLYSLGYTSLSSIIRSNLKVSILAVDGLAPTSKIVREGGYHLIRPQGLVVKDTPKGLTKEFIDFIFSENGEIILLASGYAPMKRNP